MRRTNSCFWSITQYVLAYCFSYFWRFFSGNWSTGAQNVPHSQTSDTETCISAGFPISGSCRNSISGRTSTSGIAAELRPPRTCDLRTMEVVGYKRLTSPEWVTMGVGPDSWVAIAKADLLGRVLRPEISVGTISVIFSDILTTTESAESTYLNGNYSWVKFEPSILSVALHGQGRIQGGGVHSPPPVVSVCNIFCAWLSAFRPHRPFIPHSLHPSALSTELLKVSELPHLSLTLTIIGSATLQLQV